MVDVYPKADLSAALFAPPPRRIPRVEHGYVLNDAETVQWFARPVSAGQTGDGRQVAVLGISDELPGTVEALVIRIGHATSSELLGRLLKFGALEGSQLNQDILQTCYLRSR